MLILGVASLFAHHVVAAGGRHAKSVLPGSYIWMPVIVVFIFCLGNSRTLKMPKRSLIELGDEYLNYITTRRQYRQKTNAVWRPWRIKMSCSMTTKEFSADTEAV